MAAFNSFGCPTGRLTTTCIEDVQATVLAHLVSLIDSGIKPEEIKAIAHDFSDAVATAAEDAVSELYNRTMYGEEGEGQIQSPQIRGM
jgi:hypothetical protein